MREPEPPPSVQEFVERLGVDATLRLLDECGGAPLYVPNNQAGSHEAVRLRFERQFGPETTKLLIRYFGGGEIQVPLAKQWQMEVYLARGLSDRDIARRLKCSFVTVWRHKERLRQSTRQLRFGF